MRQIILDTETTGLEYTEGHRIIEIGCVELINRRFTGKRYHQYINPERLIDEEAIAIHGITNQFLEDKPVFSSVHDEFMNFIVGAELIIHNATFDVGFINNELQLARSNWANLSKHCQVLDTLALARQIHIGQRNSLDALCKRYGVDNSDREYHGALLDAHLLGQVYLAMTGGQSSLFEGIKESTENTNASEINVVIKALTSRNLKIIKATSEELREHEAKLEKMRQKGKCVWQ